MLLGVALLNVAVLGVVGLKLSKPFNGGVTAPAAPAAKVGLNPADVYPLGKAFQAGPYTYTIAGWDTATTLDNQFSPMRAGQANEYVVVTFSVRNDSTKARVVSTEAFVLEDANGAVYRPCSQGAAAARTPLTKGDLWLPEIQPGVTKTLAAAFEVPKGLLKPPVKLLVLEQGLLGNREATVYLR